MAAEKYEPSHQASSLAWEHPSGRNGKHVKLTNPDAIEKQIGIAENKLAELKKSRGAKKDKNDWKRKIKHLRNQLQETGNEHSRIAKNQYQRNR